jgi:putative ABC transport system permease protein
MTALHALRPVLVRLRRQLDANALLAVLGVAIGCANIIALIGVTDTAGFQIYGFLRDVGAQTLFVMPFTGEGEDDVAQRANAGAFLPGEMAAQVASAPGIDTAAGILMLPGHLGRGDARQFTIVEGAEPDYPAIRGHKVARGRFIQPQDEAQHARVAVLGSALVQPLFGPEDPLGGELILKGERFTVVGVMIEKGFVGTESMDARVFIPLATMQEIYQMPGVHSVMARATSRNIRAAKAELTAYLRSLQGLTPGTPAEWEVNSVEDLTGILDSVLTIFRFLLAGVGSVALLVAGIGIMNVMLMQVIGRTYEIGIRRAVGARRRDIALQFLGEAVGQTVLGSLAGVVLGLMLALGFIHAVGWRPHITLQTVLLGIGFSTLTGVVFGLYPAWYAAHLKPIDCLRYE